MILVVEVLRGNERNAILRQSNRCIVHGIVLVQVVREHAVGDTHLLDLLFGEEIIEISDLSGLGIVTNL